MPATHANARPILAPQLFSIRGLNAVAGPSRQPPTLGTFVASARHAPLPLDQVIAQASTIIVGVVREAAWQQSQTMYELRTEDVWYGSGHRNDEMRFALDGHPFIGPGVRLVVFLSRTNEAFRVGRDGALFDTSGRRLGLTFSQLEARIRSAHANQQSSNRAEESGPSNEPHSSWSWDSWVDALFAH